MSIHILGICALCLLGTTKQSQSFRDCYGATAYMFFAVLARIGAARHCCCPLLGQDGPCAAAY